MIDKNFVTLFLVIIGFLCSSCASDLQKIGKLPETEREAIIQAVESYFDSLKQKSFGNAWELLSTKSKRTIAKEVGDNVKKLSGISMTLQEMFKDFETGGPYSKAYWEAYVANFDPDMALKDSKWEVGKIKEDYAEVILRYKTAEKPAVIRLYKEDGVWRFGLVETFWTRK